ncbi:MAG: Gfo/Idh/MocA family oxidoreductase [Planctomycetaceae bacterium]|nr:Gfo/Idh/MocA family oxidoreductase [Planctomycetaceae bacterium]
MLRREFLGTSLSLMATGLGASPVREEDRERWRVGVIGHTGHGHYGHQLHTMWLELPETQIVGLADPDDAGRNKALEQLGDVPSYGDYRTMLEEARPEIVAVCPRHLEQHYDRVMAAVSSGARGIYCEKPFCRTPAEADDIVTHCKSRGVRLALAHRNRAHPAVPVVRQAVADGIIGRVLEIRCRGLEDRRGGAQDLWVLGTHLFDLARVFAGDAVSCSAIILQDNRPVTANDLVEGEEGVGLIAGNRLHARYESTSSIPIFFDSLQGAGIKEANFGLQLIGTKGLIDFRIDVEPLAHLVPGNPFQPTSEARDWIPISSRGVGEQEPIENLQQLVSRHTLSARDLISAIIDERPPVSSAEDGRAIVEMIHAAFTSHSLGGARVSLPLSDRRHGFYLWS